MKKLSPVSLACLPSTSKVASLSMASLLVCTAISSAAQAQSGSQVDAALNTPEIVISASRVEQLTQTMPVGVTVITSEQIAKSGVTDANEAIRKIGGVAARTDLNGGREYVLDLRGYGSTASNNIVVLVDGMRISENEQTEARLSALTPEMIERIEIVRGGASVMWGEGATAGAINVITKNNAAKGVRGSTSLGLASFGTADRQAALTVGRASASFNISARDYKTNGWRDNSAYGQDVISMGAKVVESGFSFASQLHKENQNNRWPGALSFTQYAANPRLATSAKDGGSFNNTRFTNSFAYKTGGLTASIDWILRDRNVAGTFSPNTTLTKSHGSQLSPRLTYAGDVSGLAVVSTFGIDKGSSEFQKNGAFNAALGNSKNLAKYAHFEAQLKTGTRLVIGVRSETFNRQESDSSALPAFSFNTVNKLNANEFGLSQALSESLNAYVRSASSYRMPNIDDNSSTVATRALNPQTSKDREFGMKFSQGASKAVIRAFQQKNINEIYYDPNVGFGANVNLDPTKRNGIEIEGRTAMTSNWTVGGSMQTVKAVFVEGTLAGKEMPLIPKRTTVLNTTYKVDARQSIDFGARYAGASRFNNDQNNTCANLIPSNTKWDTSYLWSDKNLQFSFGVNNLFDKSSYTFGFSCTTGSLYPEVGRTFKAGVKYKF